MFQFPSLQELLNFVAESIQWNRTENLEQVTNFSDTSLSIIANGFNSFSVHTGETTCQFCHKVLSRVPELKHHLMTRHNYIAEDQ
jgi:hypothetical protein